MTSHNSETASSNKNPQVVALLAAIVVLLVVVIWLLLKGQGPVGADPGGTPISAVAPPPPPIDSPDRIRESLVAGKTYEVVLKGSFASLVEDKDWGVNRAANLGFLFETKLSRTIESNDGAQVVEVRTFQHAAATKILCESKIEFDLGMPGAIALGVLEQFQPGSTTIVLTAGPIAETILGTVSQSIADEESTQVLASVDDLTGKTVRITYIDGEGVTKVQPVGGSLTADQEAFLFQTAILSDCYLLPNTDSQPGAVWDVPGSQLGGFLDPSLRAIPRGNVKIQRLEDDEVQGVRYARLKITEGFLELDASDDATRRVGSFEPSGELRFDLARKYVSDGEFEGRLFFESVSKDHLLFETRFRSKPTLQVQYHCQMQ